jgi:hypothetical protein
MHSFEIMTNSDSYNPGETVMLFARFKSDKPVKARSVSVILICHEKEKKTELHHIPHDERRRMEELGLVVTTPVKPVDVFSDKDTYKKEKTIKIEKEISDERYEFHFELPKDAHPTSYEMGHDNRLTNWHLLAKIDIPMAPDINKKKEIIVKGLV